MLRRNVVNLAMSSSALSSFSADAPATEAHPLLARVEAALDVLRPYLATDGGNVRVAAITDEMVVQLEWEGACGACPMSPMTRAGLEDSIKKAVPEIQAVEAR
jgi:Fe-S cluster biogenesis protein NfuA